MTEKIALISDIHGNPLALRAILAEISREHCAKMFMLGDIINGLDPHGSIQLLRSWRDTNHVELTAIKGNAEAYLMTPDRPLLMQQPQWDLDLLKLLQWWQEHLSDEDLAWVASLPVTIHQGGTLLVHDSPIDRMNVQAQPDVPAQYRELNYHGRGIPPDMPEADWRALAGYMRAEGLRQVFSGHTHRPFYKTMDDLLVANPGSVGMPLDGDPRASWALLTIAATGEQSVTIHRVTYDLSAMLQLIDDTPDYYDFQTPGFREAYKKMFEHGTHWSNWLK